jgi:hypothetical protein
LITHLIAPFVGRCFFRTVRRWPVIFALIALGGEGIGVWAVFVEPGNWMLAGIGVLIFVFYTWLLILLLSKLRGGTWGAFCDWAISLFERNDRIT